MTVETTTARVAHLGAGTTGPFTIPFYFLANADIRAVKVLIADGSETELVLNTDFTLTGAGDEDGGALTTTAAVTSDYRLVIFRDPELLQEADYTANDRFPSETHEQVADRLTMIAQRTSDLLGRALVQPDGDADADMRLPAAAVRASKYLAFDADGEPVATSGTGESAVISTFAETFLDDESASEVRTTLGAVGLTGDETVAGAKTFSGSSTFGGKVALTGDISPTQLAANTNNWAPTGLSGASVIRFSTDARRNITGLTGGEDGREITLHNVGTFPAAFKYEDSNSTDVNRFAFGHTVSGGHSIVLQYDATSERWRCKSKELPAGTEIEFHGDTVPEGFLALDGSNRNRTTYAALFNEIGTTWGVGDGVNTFGTADTRRRVAVGTGGAGTATLDDLVGSTGGAETVTLATANLPASGLSATLTGTYSGASSGGAGSTAASLGNVAVDTTSSAGLVSVSGTTANMGSGTATNIMQPGYVVTKCIKY